MSRKAKALLEPELVAGIYEAIAEPDVLAALAAIVRRAVDVDSAGLWIKRDGAVVAVASTPDVVESVGPWLAYFIRLDPWMVQSKRIVGQAWVGYEHVPEVELLASEFYNDFARYYGMRNPMGVVHALSPGLTLSISTNRTAGHSPLDASDKPRFAALAGHVLRALRTRERLGLSFVGPPDRGSPAVALDALACGMAVCDGLGRALHLNAAAQALVLRGALTVRGRPPRLGAPLRKEDEALARLIFEAGAGRGGGGLRLTDPGGRHLSALVVPLPPAIEDGFGPGKVLVAVREADAVPSPDAAMLRALYGLSPAQAELCVALAAGQTFEEAAAARGVAVSTLRTHFAAALARTDARNLRDLIRLLGTLPPLR